MSRRLVGYAARSSVSKENRTIGQISLRSRKTIGTSEVPIVVYSSYERQVIDELASNLPDLSVQLLSLRELLFDLLPIVREHYYHPGFGGSFSIKAVGPTLAPEVDYAGLEGSQRVTRLPRRLSEW